MTVRFRKRPAAAPAHAARLLLLLLCAAASQAQQYTISTVAGGAFPSTPALGINLAIGVPRGLATDSSGNAYFTSLNSVFRLSGFGIVTQLAGNTRAGFAGDGGLASSAQLSSPAGLAIDSAGDIYIADSGNNRVREILASSGVIITVAGSGVQGFSGDGGPAVNAALSGVSAVVLDSSGNLYLADSGNNRVRKVSPAGIITTIAGNGNAASSGDGGPAVSAQLSATSLAIDSFGDLFVGDSANYRVREITAAGIISTVAGSGTSGYTGDGNNAAVAQLSAFGQIAVDRSGDLYIADTGNSCIREVYSGTNAIATIAGIGRNAYYGDNQLATNAAMAFPQGVALDASRDIFIADSGNNRVREVTASNGVINTVAGNGSFSDSGDGGPALSAQLYGPGRIALDASGNLFIPDTGNNVVREVALNGTISTVAGNGTPGFSGDGGAPSQALLFGPQSVALDAAADLFIADSGNYRVREVSQGVINTVAGSGNSNFAGDGASALNAGLSAAGVAVDKAGDVFIADPVNYRVREVLASTGNILTVAGAGLQGYSGDNGPAASATFSGIEGIALDSSGNLYIADSGNNCIRQVSTAGVITTIAGNGTPGFSGDGGPATAAQLRQPSAVAVDSSGNIFIADTNNNRVRRVSTTGVITTVAGSGAATYTGDGGLASNAGLFHPSGLAIAKSGNVYVADSGNNAIRLLTPDSQTIQITAVVDAASESATALSPGKIVVIYGTGLGPSQLTVNQPVNGLFGDTLAGTSVSFRGILAPLYYTSATQVAAIVPYELTGSSSVPVEVAYQSQLAAAFTAPVAATSPGLFTANASGTGQAAAINVVDGSLNSAANPVKIGAYISFYATGEGQTSPAGVDGKVAPLTTPLPAPLARVSVTIGGIAANVAYAGAAPGEVAGLMQVNVQVPAGVTPGGYVPVVLTVGGVSTPSGALWIAVSN